MLQAGLGVVQSDACSAVPIPFAGADAVADGKPAGRIKSLNRNFDPSVVTGGSDAMADRVLYERLQNHLRDQELPGGRLNPLSDGKPRPKPHLLQVEIRLDEFEFVLQQHQV